ncbi:MAG: fused MFS/spermidine synthase [bacterium]
MSLQMRLVRPTVVVLFLLSGASGLIFETLWMRLLTTTFGATTFALSTVLTAFMGGLALGGYLSGRIADRLRRPSTSLLLYGLLELVVAGYALFFPSLLGSLHELHGAIWAHWEPGPYAFALIRFVIVSAVLIVPTTAMGATLPILSRYYAQREGLGKEVGTLYAVNVFGAVSGTFLAGFVLMPSLGLTATNRTACSLNLLLGIAAIGLARLVYLREEQPTVGPPPDADGERTGPWSRTVWVALVAVAVSGVASMVYQQAWTRVLALVVGSSVYAFALILMAFLLGLALGGAVYARRTAHLPGQLANLAVIHVIIALTVLVGTAFMDRLPALFVALTRQTAITPSNVFGLKFAVCALVVLLPTFFLGMIFPATIAVCAESMTGVGRTVGRVYSVNTLGAIVGSFLGGFALIPALGVQRTMVAMILVNLALAGVFTAVARIGRRDRLLRVVAIGLVLGAVAAIGLRRWQPHRMTAGVFRLSLFDPSRAIAACPGPQDPLSRLFETGPGRAHVIRAQRLVGFRPDIETACDQVVGRRLLSFREGVVATVSTWQVILEGFEPQTCWEVLALQVNGKSDASASAAFRRPKQGRCQDLLGHPERIVPARVSPRSDMETQVLSGLLGQLLFGGQGAPQRALVIGWGSGVTVGSMAVTGLRHIDAVELEPEVLRAARVFSRYNHRASRRAEVRLVEADGRNYLIAVKQPYDIIVSEPSNPWMTGAASLFTREFFQLIRSRLRPDGVFIQWLQLYEISRENVACLVGTLRSVFPNVTIFRPRHAKVDLLLVATNNPVSLDVRRIARRMAPPSMRSELARIRVENPGDLLARHLANDAQVRKRTRGVPLNTDDNARVEFSAPKDLINYRKHSHKKIVDWLGRGATPVSRLVKNVRAGDEASLSLQLVDAFLKLGDLSAAERELRRLPTSHSGGIARRRLVRLLRDPLRVAAPLRRALAAHDRLRASTELPLSHPQQRLLARLRIAATGPRSASTFRLMGLLLASTPHRGLSFLFLSAAKLLPGAEDLDVGAVRVKLLRLLSLHELAFRSGLGILTAGSRSQQDRYFP